ncbi:MAG: ABC transporter ATP-binding protein [Bacteroidota bacterium]|nr:ABC transporter ATP-binding protein [Bacteroidota bacterium]
MTLEAVTKRYSRASVFAPVSFTASSGKVLSITGSNGSGKSTLLKIIAGVTAPSRGICSWSFGDSESIPTNPNREKRNVDFQRDLQKILGFVSPYLELYYELTAIEHVQFVAELKGYHITNDEAVSELTSFGLDPMIARSERTLKQYSSGMQQRVRLAMAFIAAPKVLLLDEPSSNLDEVGIGILFRRIEDAVEKGALAIIATNDEREKNLASKEISLSSIA